MTINNEQIRAEQIMQTWCMAFSESIRQKDLDRHMRLVSRRVQVYGMPTKENINYPQWQLRRENEFKNDEILALNFNDKKLISRTQKRLRFRTSQTMLGKDGKMVILDKNITLEFEDDQVWRVIEEMINSWEIRQLDMASFQQGIK